MNKLFKFVDKAASSAAASAQPAAHDAFKEHWRQVAHTFSKSLVSDEDMLAVKSHLRQMVRLLLDELNSPNSYLSLKPLAFVGEAAPHESVDYGPVWNYLFANNVFEAVFLWSLSYPEYMFDMKHEQLRYCSICKWGFWTD